MTQAHNHPARNWAQWRLFPIVEEPDHETSFQNWLAQLAEENDVAKLSELAEDIERTIKSLNYNAPTQAETARRKVPTNRDKLRPHQPGGG